MLRNAVILAAGAGRRLGNLTAWRPKALLPLGSSTLIDFSLAQLSSRGIHRITIVAGYRAFTLRKHIETKWGATLSLTFIVNPYYLSRNNLFSLRLAKEFFHDGTLLLNSDIIYDSHILDAVLGAGCSNVMAVDSSKTLHKEEMKVCVSPEGIITQIGKWIPVGEAQGEYIGMMTLDKAGYHLVSQVIDELVNQGNSHLYYEDAIHKVCGSLHIKAVSTEGHLWHEVDTTTDLEEAYSIYRRLFPAT